MDFNVLAERARQTRQHYVDFETERYGRPWSDEEIALGLVGDVGDLVKLIQAKNGVRVIDDVDDKLAHELADCLWAVMVLAHTYDVDLEQAFIKTMDDLEQYLIGNER